MAEGAFGFFYNKLGLSIDRLSSYFDFSESGSVVSPVSGSCLGEILGGADFWSNTGSGKLSEGLLISGFENVASEDWSIMVVFEKLRKQNEVIFSTIDSGQTSGIVAHLNDLNRLTITTPDTNGYLFSQTFSLPFSNKNIISINKSGPNISCLYYDPSILSGISESKSFPSSCNLNNFNSLLFGKSELNSISDFSGFLDEVVLLDFPINTRQFSILSSGFLRDAYSGSVTYESGFGFGHAYCSDSYITGWSQSGVPVRTETPSEVNFEFLKTFQKSGLKYVNCQTINSLQVVSLESNPIKFPNFPVKFDGTNSVFRTSSSVNFADTLFYKNGILQTKVADYLYSNRSFVQSGVSFQDAGILDVLSHSYNIHNFSSGDLVSGYGIPHNGNSIFFVNGLNLISGVDYTIGIGSGILNTNEFSNTSGSITEIVFSDPISVNFTTDKFLNFGFYDSYILPFVDRKRFSLTDFLQLPSVSVNFENISQNCQSNQSIYLNQGNYFNE